MAKYLLRGMVLPMTGPADFLPEGEVAVEGERIVHVGETGTVPKEFEPERIFDLPDDVIMPGLINTHTHAAMTMMRGYADDMPLMPWLEEKIWPFEEKMNDEDIFWGTSLALCEMIKSGTTAMADMYLFEEATAEAVLAAGTRALLSRGMVGFDPQEGERFLKENIELYQKYNGSGQGRIQVYFGPHAPYTCPGDYLKLVKQEADRLKTGIHIHIAETKTEIQTIREQYGKTPVRWLEELGFFGGPVIAAHCVYIEVDEIPLLKKHAVKIAHNPESNMKLNSGTAPVPKFLDNGIVVGIGTDGTSSNNNLDMLEEMRTAAFQQKLICGSQCLQAYEVLEMATAEGAKVLGFNDTGKLAPGFKADIITVDFDKPHFYPRFSVPSHLVYSANGSDVRTVFVNGKILMENRELITLDEKKICREVEKRAKQIAFQI